eukprot:gene6289-6525_t
MQTEGDHPWNISSYYSKKLSRATDQLGNIVQSPDTIAEPMAWDASSKYRVVARDAGLTVETLQARVHLLQSVLPGIDAKLAVMKPGDV